MLKVDQEFYLYCTVIMYITDLQMSYSQKFQEKCELENDLEKNVPKT